MMLNEHRRLLLDEYLDELRLRNDLTGRQRWGYYLGMLKILELQQMMEDGLLIPLPRRHRDQ